MKRHQPFSLPRAAMKLLCTLLGIILAVMLCVSFAFQHLLNQIRFQGPQPAATLGEALEVIDLSAASQQPEIIGGRGSGMTNILLIGQDRREGETFARSDSMILCTIHRDSAQITMTSFLRDLYVPIPGHGSNRINAAYAGGGMPLLKQTLEESFLLHIDGCIEVDFSQFTQIIDLLGGVSMELRPDEAEIINQETGSSLTQGQQVLNGIQALTYSRIRKLDIDGDFSRTQRQRNVLEAIVNSYRQAGISKIIPLVGEILPMITTDLNQGQILLLAMETLPHLSSAQLISQRIPAEGTYQDTMVDGMSVLVPDLKKNQELLRQTLSGK